jgi:hypothetical protein
MELEVLEDHDQDDDHRHHGQHTRGHEPGMGASPAQPAALLKNLLCGALPTNRTMSTFRHFSGSRTRGQRSVHPLQQADLTLTARPRRSYPPFGHQ